ncbi:MAG: chromosomal replication initiator protein DnaA, partial [Candidatus Omnitrophica bacterium]|nr:chromosomal replication initiator protein DnaA [Candidatus Omnitrophota bacterium]
MDKRASELWTNVLQLIEPQVTTQTFQTWFLPIKAASYTGDTVTIEVPNEFVKNWLVDHHYTTIIESSVKNITGQSVEVKILISKEKRPEHKTETESKIKKAQDGLVTYLNSKYTFDSFVVGQSNRFAHAASLAVAESPAKAYNPLFIYGGVGLGKTHLMQAMGHFLLNKNRDTSIIYVSSETFTNQLINAIQNRTTQKF